MGEALASFPDVQTQNLFLIPFASLPPLLSPLTSSCPQALSSLGFSFQHSFQAFFAVLFFYLSQSGLARRSQARLDASRRWPRRSSIRVRTYSSICSKLRPTGCGDISGSAELLHTPTFSVCNGNPCHAGQALLQPHSSIRWPSSALLGDLQASHACAYILGGFAKP